MKKSLALLLATLPALVIAQPPKSVAWDIVEGLTTEVGHRQAGTEAEARARDWAVIKLKALGFSNVRIETYSMPTWVRGEEKATVTFNGVRFPLAITALGNSGATPANGIEGAILPFESLDALKAAPDAQVKGRIIYIGHKMRPTQDGSSYGYFGAVRRQGPNIAAKKGAAAFIIRSIGTDSHRIPHTGNTNFDTGVTPIPSAAISNPDADQLERQMRLGIMRSGILDMTPRIQMVLTPKFIGQQQSGNVLAEIPGTDSSAGIVLVGGHLDSWDLGTGAIDDGAGVAITAAAAHNILKSGKKPRRMIRVVWFGAEEVGLWGGKAYFEAHKNEPHALAAESDFGADRVWRVDFKLPDAAKALAERITLALAQLGIAASKEVASEGADIGPLLSAGVSSVALNQDGTRYFDLHHTPDDTLDKIDPVQLEQNVQAWTIMLGLVANAPENLMPLPKTVPSAPPIAK